jgi:hypothetical protein
MALSINVPMPSRLTHYVLCAAIEGGSYGASWLRDYSSRVQYGAYKGPHGGVQPGDYVALHIGAPYKGAECDVPVKHSRIGASRIAAALALMLASPNYRHCEAAGRVIGGNFDALDADVVLQFAAFGEVVYG